MRLPCSRTPHRICDATGNRTPIDGLKNHRPEPLDDSALCYGTWIRTKINKFKAYCPTIRLLRIGKVGENRTPVWWFGGTQSTTNLRPYILRKQKDLNLRGR